LSICTTIPLEWCARSKKTYHTSDFSIGHRGACLQFPEHTIESYKAAIRQGAGVVECDVTFTKDLQLVCRHAQCDLHTTTDVVTRPELNAKCTIPFVNGTAPKCCTSDFTLAEIQTLCAKMDSFNSKGTTPQTYAFGGTADWRTDLYQSGCPKVPTHLESLLLMKSQNVKYTPELKSPEVAMPFMGTYTQEMYAQQLVDDYVSANVPPRHVWLQSFSPVDVFYWVNKTSYGDQAVALDGNDLHNITETIAWLDNIKANGGKIVAPPMQRLIVASNSSEYGAVASPYAIAAKERGLGIITWTLERAPPGLQGYYYSSTFGQGVYTNDGDMYNVLYVLAFVVNIQAIFSDWPATVTFFANCFNLKIRKRNCSW
jgi:glycerophosphoryl diester phosphodiesterase